MLSSVWLRRRPAVLAVARRRRAVLALARRRRAVPALAPGDGLWSPLWLGGGLQSSLWFSDSVLAVARRQPAVLRAVLAPALGSGVVSSLSGLRASLTLSSGLQSSLTLSGGLRSSRLRRLWSAVLALARWRRVPGHQHHWQRQRQPHCVARLAAASATSAASVTLAASAACYPRMGSTASVPQVITMIGSGAGGDDNGTAEVPQGHHHHRRRSSGDGTVSLLSLRLRRLWWLRTLAAHCSGSGSAAGAPRLSPRGGGGGGFGGGGFGGVSTVSLLSL